MNKNEYRESDIDNVSPILKYIESIKKQENELVLSSEGEIVGAILTTEQYNWFLDKIDESQDLVEIAKRVDDRNGEQSLDDFKKELRE